MLSAGEGSIDPPMGWRWTCGVQKLHRAGRCSAFIPAGTTPPQRPTLRSWPKPEGVLQFHGNAGGYAVSRANSAADSQHCAPRSVLRQLRVALIGARGGRSYLSTHRERGSSSKTLTSAQLAAGGLTHLGLYVVRKPPGQIRVMGTQPRAARHDVSYGVTLSRNRQGIIVQSTGRSRLTLSRGLCFLYRNA